MVKPLTEGPYRGPIKIIDPNSRAARMVPVEPPRPRPHPMMGLMTKGDGMVPGRPTPRSKKKTPARNKRGR